MVLVFYLKGTSHGVHGQPIIIVKIDDFLHTRVHKSHKFQLRTYCVEPIDLIVRIFVRVLEVKSCEIRCEFIIYIYLSYFELACHTKRLHGWMSRVVKFGESCIQINLHPSNPIHKTNLCLEDFITGTKA